MDISQTYAREWITKTGNHAKLTVSYYCQSDIRNEIIRYFRPDCDIPFRVVYKQS